MASLRDRLCWSLLVTLTLSGCAASDAAQPGRAAAPLLHLVAISMVDPSAQARDELQHDCDLLLSGIPSVIEYSAGRPVDTGRESVVADYDLMLLIGFEDEAGYRAYVEHPDHVALVAKWKPRLSGLVVRDVGL